MSGRYLYPANKEGEKEFLRVVSKKSGGRIKKSDMDRILEEMNSSPFKDIFFFPEDKRADQRQ